MQPANKALITQQPDYSVPREGNDCPICLGPFLSSETPTVTVTNCQHVYHQDCIQKWLSEHNNCPLCRRKVEKTSFVHLINNSEMEDPLVTACRNGNIDFIAKQYAQSHDALTSFHWSNTHGEEVPLIVIATESNQPEVVRLLLQYDPDSVTHCCTNGTDALITAAKMGGEDIARLLLESGADINYRNADGLSPLHMAAEKGHTAFVDFLLENHADINTQDQYLRTPLMLASWRGCIEIAETLIHHGCNMNLSPKNAQISALTYALDKGHLALADLLLQSGINVVPKDLYAAARQDNSSGQFIRILEKLKDTLSPDAFEQTINGSVTEHISPLRDCARKGTADNVQALLDHGADPEAKGSNGHTALYFAAVYGHLDSVQRFLAHGSETNVTVFHGLSMLMATITQGHYRVATALAKHPGTDIHLGHEGETPLTACVNREDVDMELLNTLLEAGAQIDSGRVINPLAFAIIQHPIEVISALIDHQNKEKINQPVLTPNQSASVFSNEHGSLRGCFQTYYDQFRSEDVAGMRPLTLAIVNNKPEAVKRLVKAGAYVTENDLKLAEILEIKNVIPFLQSQLLPCSSGDGHSTEVQAAENYTPLASAIIRGLSAEDIITGLPVNKKGDIEMVNHSVVDLPQSIKLLEEKLPKTDRRDEYCQLLRRSDQKGMRPLTLAVLYQNQPAFETLIKTNAYATINDYRLARLVGNETMQQMIYQKLPERFQQKLDQKNRQ